MKTLQKLAFVIAVMSFLASCEQKTNAKISLSKSETRKEIMNSIVNNSEISRETIETMKNSENREKWLQENDKLSPMMCGNHGSIMK